MKLKALAVLGVVGLIASQANAGVGPIGNYTCFNKSNVTAVYTAEMGARGKYSPNSGTLQNIKKLSPQNGCYYGETTAGSDGAIPAKCFVAFVKKASQPNWGKTNKDYTAAQCVFHNKPDEVVSSKVQFQTAQIYNDILHKGDYDGSFDKELENNYGVAVCLDDVTNTSLDGYGQYAFCELMSNTRDSNGKRERIATLNFQMTPGVVGKKGSTTDDSQATESNTNTTGQDNNPANKLKKKLGW